MITVASSGSTEGIEAFLKSMSKLDISKKLDSYARAGRDALAAATPLRTGRAANAWSYVIEADKETLKIIWTNSDVEDGFPVVIGLQYGYVTGTGGYVHGRDFINPAIRPIFDQIQNALWREVTSG